MAAASSLRNGAFLLARQRMARGWERRMCMSRNGSGAGNTGGGGGPANGGAANSGGARVNGSGGGGGPANGGAANSVGARGVSGGGGGAAAGGGGGVDTGASNCGWMGSVSGGAASTGGGASGSGGVRAGGGVVANSGGGARATGGVDELEELRKEMFERTRGLWDKFNQRADADRELFATIRRLRMNTSTSHVDAKEGLMKTTHRMVAFAGVFMLVWWVSVFLDMRSSIADATDEEVQRILAAAGGSPAVAPRGDKN